MNTVHAFLVSGVSIETADIPIEYKHQSADVTHVIADTLGIDEARSLIASSSTKAVSGQGRTFVIAMRGATVEAQNALLKLLEEPPIGSRFYIIVPHPSLLLPTLQSRLLRQNSESTLDTSVAEAFIALDIKGRMQVIAEHAKQKDTVWIERVVRGSAALVKDAPELYTNALGSVTFAELYIGIRGASKKMLLEELALILPVKK